MANKTPIFITLLILTLWSGGFIVSGWPWHWFGEFGHFSLLGIVGAIFANATGAGGGVVFVPVFNHLGFDNTQIIATSFGIQCCGMTAGAFAWRRYASEFHRGDPQWSSLWTVLSVCIPFTWLGVFSVQYLSEILHGLSQILAQPKELNSVFGIFSILLALAIFASSQSRKQGAVSTQLSPSDWLLLALTSLAGGVITAWLSVGVGELIAVYLVLRRFSVTFAIAVAVILSAFTVWFAVIHHVLNTQAIVYPVVFFAGLGAIVGGTLAKHLVLLMSPQLIKRFFAAWILVLGIGSLPING